MQNKTKISFCLCANFPLFCRHKQKNFSWGIAPNPHQGIALTPVVGLQCSPDAHLHTRALCALLSVHLNNQSIKMRLFQPLWCCIPSKNQPPHELLDRFWWLSQPLRIKNDKVIQSLTCTKTSHTKSFIHGHFECWYCDMGCSDYLIIFN